MANHDIVDGLIIFGSRFDESWFPEGSLTAANTLPVFIAHGEQESPASLERAKGASETLRDLGFSVMFRPFDGGHSVPLNIVAEVVTWIEDQRDDHGHPGDSQDL